MISQLFGGGSSSSEHLKSHCNQGQTEGFLNAIVGFALYDIEGCCCYHMSINIKLKFGEDACRLYCHCVYVTTAAQFHSAFGRIAGICEQRHHITFSHNVMTAGPHMLFLAGDLRTSPQISPSSPMHS